MSEEQLRAATERILSSDSRKKLIVAGPGAGKTYIFKRLLEQSEAAPERHLVLTFIKNLKRNLEADLGDLANVRTLHGYCFGLMKRQRAVRGHLTGDFRCLPGLPAVIKADWELVHEEPAPQFVNAMQHAEDTEAIAFYLARGNYYDAVAFDDSVYRVYLAWRDEAADIEDFELVLIDEYQDFNALEAQLIDMLGTDSAIVIAGDDDQALYSQLRAANWDFIRNLHAGDEFEVFELPFCMRCPRVVVEAVNDVIERARRARVLVGRIEKPYQYYEPFKGEDSQRYPAIDRVACTTQRLNANYFGRYIAQQIAQIPRDEIEQAIGAGDAPVLVIGARQYLRQIAEHLENTGFSVETRAQAPPQLDRIDGVRILKEDEESNLGWRIILEFEPGAFAHEFIRRAIDTDEPLHTLLPEEFKERVLSEAQKFEEETDNAAQEEVTPEHFPIRLVSFESAKGLSAQHVFIVGMHEGEMPRNAAAIHDLEVCRFLVGLTRAKKKCTIMCTDRFGAALKRPSLFLSWIRQERFRQVRVNAQYW